MLGRPSHFMSIFAVVVASFVAIQACSRRGSGGATELCKKDAAGKCVKNAPVVRGEEPGATPTPRPCTATEITLGSLCQDGVSYCATQLKEFHAPTCVECSAGTVWDGAGRRCASTNGQGTRPTPTPSPTPTQPPVVTRPSSTPAPTPTPTPTKPPAADVPPKVELKVDPNDGLKVVVRFDKTTDVSNVRYDFTAGDGILLEGAANSAGTTYTFAGVAIPVKITFTYKTRTCTVTSRATLPGSGFLAPNGC